MLAFGSGAAADELEVRRGAVLFARPWEAARGNGTCADCHPAAGAGPGVRPPAARLAPGLRGVGLLARIPKGILLAAADADDRDRDGVSGRLGAGRFGWKADQAQLADQVLSAMRAELEVVDAAPAEVEALVAYLAALRPAPSAVPVGAALFAETGCAACHTPTYTIPSDPGITGTTTERIAPFTDLLLHDLGPGLADAAGAEWRTAPLWGLRLRTAFLHDGRAENPRDAIAWHGGEAAGSREHFAGLPAARQEELLAFLARL